MKRALITISILLQACLGCVKEPEPYVITCVDGVVDFEYFKSRPQYFTFKNDNEAITSRGYAIQSMLEWQYYLESNSFGGLPEVDFERHTILIGRHFSSQVARMYSQEILSNCAKKTVDYNITLAYEGDASAGTEYYYVIIPKISEEMKVNFNVEKILL